MYFLIELLQAVLLLIVIAANPFMTPGLMKSRDTKNKMYFKTLTDPSDILCTEYKDFCKIYYKTVRAAKKQHFTQKLQANTSDVKKTWDTLSEIQRNEI